MFKEQLKNIADFVHTHNRYFGKHFANAWQDEETGSVYAELDNESTCAIFPAEKFGDYFYIRQQKRATLSEDPRFRISDTYLSGVMATSTAVLVAIMSNVDEQHLMNNLVNTLGMYTPGIVRPISMYWDKDTLVRSELKGANDDEVQATLNRIHNQSMIAIEFALSSEVNYQKLSCLESPCKKSNI